MDDLEFVLPWIKKQANTTRSHIRIVQTLLYIFYGICFLGSIGLDFPETRSFWLGLPGILASSIEKDPAIVLAALNVVSSVYLGWTGNWNLGLHMTLCAIAGLRATTFVFFIFCTLYVIGVVLNRVLMNNLAIYAESIERLHRIEAKTIDHLQSTE